MRVARWTCRVRGVFVACAWKDLPRCYASVATGKELRQRCVASGRLSLHCYFRPISKCSHNSSSNGQRHRDSSSFRFLSSTIDLSHRLDQLGNLTGLRSEVLVMGTLLSWIMRPQPELRLAIEQYGAALGLSPNGGSSSRREVRHRQLALHIRRGDKYSLHAKHMHNHTWRVSPASFIAWSRRIASDIGAERVLYMTDDVRHWGQWPTIAHPWSVASSSA